MTAFVDRLLELGWKPNSIKTDGLKRMLPHFTFASFCTSIHLKPRNFCDRNESMSMSRCREGWENSRYKTPFYLRNTARKSYISVSHVLIFSDAYQEAPHFSLEIPRKEQKHQGGNIAAPFIDPVGACRCPACCLGPIRQMETRARVSTKEVRTKRKISGRAAGGRSSTSARSVPVRLPCDPGAARLSRSFVLNYVFRRPDREVCLVRFPRLIACLGFAITSA